MCHIFFIHASVSGRLDCFRVLAIVSSAAMTIEMYVWAMKHMGHVFLWACDQELDCRVMW